MSMQQLEAVTPKKLQQLILQEKTKGTPNVEIGRKYGVTFRYIEKLITKSRGINISNLNNFKKVKTLQPKDFKEEQTTVWSFKQRGNWATHSGEYRGNWSPYIPRNVILKYSKPGELVLDYFCGAGTTAVEAKLLGRKCMALDINDKAVELARQNLDFKVSSHESPILIKNHHPHTYEPELLVEDARKLSFLPNNSIDLICSHPPYANILQYTDSKDSDLSFLDIDDFLKEMSKVAHESFRVLKPGRQCAILIGDTRRKKNVVSLGFKLINTYLDAGFKLRELVIKRQHNCKTTGFWYANSIKYNFLLLAHEYLPIFEKPKKTTPQIIKEQVAHYGMFGPVTEKPALQKKLKDFETTTVWVFPEINFEECLNKNVISRYSKEAEYSTINFISQSNNQVRMLKKEGRKEKKLLFIKSAFLNDESSFLNIRFYLEKVKEIVNKELPSITNGGFIIIQTRDVRVDGYIEPLGKKLIDLINYNQLCLKEIIMVTKKDSQINITEQKNYLKTTHQYLLVYEVKK